MATTKKLEELIEELSSLQKKISSGNASIDEAIALQECSQKIYERATWLKFKAMENHNTTEPEASVPESKPVPEPQPETQPKTQEPTERPSFDFTGAFASAPEEEAPTKENTFTEKTEEKVEEKAPEETPPAESQTSLLDAIGTDDDSINDALMVEEDNSLASKMQKSPIKDITTAIGMNDRFSYINELFDENAEQYNNAIHQLNNLNNKVEAKEKLSEMAVDHSWDLESKIVQMFVELVERRYS